MMLGYFETLVQFFFLNYTLKAKELLIAGCTYCYGRQGRIS